MKYFYEVFFCAPKFSYDGEGRRNKFICYNFENVQVHTGNLSRIWEYDKMRENVDLVEIRYIKI